MFVKNFFIFHYIEIIQKQNIYIFVFGKRKSILFYKKKSLFALNIFKIKRYQILFINLRDVF